MGTRSTTSPPCTSTSPSSSPPCTSTTPRCCPARSTRSRCPPRSSSMSSRRCPSSPSAPTTSVPPSPASTTSKLTCRPDKIEIGPGPWRLCSDTLPKVHCQHIEMRPSALRDDVLSYQKQKTSEQKKHDIKD